ncbi:MAG: hypothetical protein KDA21_13355, partial [Phycisphaerales bacterium]|nr:hypothetical protein [Phycisphaerales bacterium]
MRTRIVGWTLPLVMAGAAAAQDSVAVTPGMSDALPADGTQTVRYLVDLVEITSSWGNAFAVAPLLKAGADADPLFPTQILGATAVSPDQRTGLSFAPTDFASWSTPGAGVNPTQNSAPSTTSVSGFDRRFGVAITDFNAEASNIIGALVGQNAAEPMRLYVTRTVAVSSQPASAGVDTATLSLGGVDADGLTHIRADDFNTSDSLAVDGENLVTVDLAARSAGVNILTNAGPADTGATTFVLMDDGVTLNTPVAMPGSVGTAAPLTLDFANSFRPGAGSPVSSHLAAGVPAHRGNPSLTLGNFSGSGVATLGTLSISSIVENRADTLDLFAVTGAGAVSDTRAATLPSPVSDGSFTTNGAGDAEFHHYYSQLGFRGPSGPVGLSIVGTEPVAAATALDPSDGEFIAVASMGSAATTWDVAAFIGKPVLDGPGGSTVGSVIAASPASLSSPAVDGWGNVYFIAAYEPTGGPEGTALIKAVRTSGGYELERLLTTGDVVTGANSGRTWTVDALTLADGDSVASGSLHAGAILQPVQPGFEAGAAADARAFGGLVVNATITYDNGGTPETYEAALFVGPSLTPGVACEGDTNGDNMVNF